MANVVGIVKTDLILTIHTTMNDLCLVQLFVCGDLAPGQLLPCPMEAVVDPLSKYLLLCSPVQWYQVQMKL